MNDANLNFKHLDFDSKSPEFEKLSKSAHNGNAQAQHAFAMWNELHGNIGEARR